jgi:hypothetical protein
MDGSVGKIVTCDRRRDPAAQHWARRTYLDSVDAERRRLRLSLVSDDLFRKGSNPGQRRRMRRLAPELRNQARMQMRAKSRRAFRGEVAVEIDLHAVRVEQPAASPPAVKAYLDLLEGIAYPNDEVVSYLRVTRHAGDNPWFRREGDNFDLLYGSRPRIPYGPEGHVEAEVLIQPVRTYISDFDRVFRLREEVFGDGWEIGDEPGAEFFSKQFDHGADSLRMDDLLEEEEDDQAAGGVSSFDAALGERFRRMRQAELRALRRKLLLGHGPDSMDRPGPPSPFTQWLWRLSPDLKTMQTETLRGPGRFILPLPPTTSGGEAWRETVRGAMTSHHSGWGILDALQGTALALDIALRGVTQSPRDLDNLARDVVGPFEEVFCGDERGAVASYRVYRADLGPPGVTVHVLADERLESLERAIDSARQWMLARGPRFKEAD